MSESSSPGRDVPEPNVPEKDLRAVSPEDPVAGEHEDSAVVPVVPNSGQVVEQSASKPPPALRAHLPYLSGVAETLKSIEHSRAFIQQAADAARFARPAVPPDVFNSLRAIAPPVFFSPSVLPSFSQQVVEMANAARRAFDNSAVKALTSYQNALRNRVAETVEAFTRFKPVFGEFLAEQVRSFLEARSFLHWMLARDLVERGWWLVPTWPGSLLTELWTGMAERRGRRVVDQILLAHYRYNRNIRLGASLRSWIEPEFVARAKTFRQALAHHRARRFSAAIALLTPHVEGVLKEFLVAEGLVTPQQARKRGTPGLVKSHFSRPSGHASLPGFVLRLQRLYTEFTWGTPTAGRGVARNPLSHGAAVAPDSEVETLQLFLMLDTLHYFLSDLRRRKLTKAEP